MLSAFTIFIKIYIKNFNCIPTMDIYMHGYILNLTKYIPNTLKNTHVIPKYISIMYVLYMYKLHYALYMYYIIYFVIYLIFCMKMHTHMTLNAVYK